MDRNICGLFLKILAHVALRKESVDRNVIIAPSPTAPGTSLSARRAWIEIPYITYQLVTDGVALRKESVDRNLDFQTVKCFHCVALRKESVDRNIAGNRLTQTFLVALRKESVDRNISPIDVEYVFSMSLSARRAWIEMPRISPSLSCLPVALRKESVDRNASRRTRSSASL